MELSVKGQQVFSKIQGMSKPVVAAICGHALGGGLELALACDFRVAADNSELGFPETKLGLIPAWGGTQRLPLIVGSAKAKRLIMLGDRVKADKALEMVLVDKVFSLKDLIVETEKFAKNLCECSPAAVKYAKMTINSVVKVSAEGLKRETEAFVRLFSAKEPKEKLESFGSQRNKQ